MDKTPHRECVVVGGTACRERSNANSYVCLDMRKRPILYRQANERRLAGGLSSSATDRSWPIVLLKDSPRVSGAVIRIWVRRVIFDSAHGVNNSERRRVLGLHFARAEGPRQLQLLIDFAGQRKIGCISDRRPNLGCLLRKRRSVVRLSSRRSETALYRRRQQRCTYAS